MAFPGVTHGCPAPRSGGLGVGMQSWRAGSPSWWARALCQDVPGQGPRLLLPGGSVVLHPRASGLVRGLREDPPCPSALRRWLGLEATDPAR